MQVHIENIYNVFTAVAAAAEAKHGQSLNAHGSTKMDSQQLGQVMH